MNRRDVFKLFVAGVVSLLGMKGLAETLRGPEMVQGISDVQPLQPVMGEQAHWPQFQELETFFPPDWEPGRPVYIAAAKIDGEWVDTSDELPDQIRKHLQPRPFKRRHV